MKTFLFNTIDRYRQYSQGLDAKAILCQKAWYVLNEEEQHEIFIFDQNGSVMVSTQGNTKHYKWEFLPQNSSINIRYTEMDGILLKPAFMCEDILVLRKEGTNECMFLIDDKSDKMQKVRSINAVKQYFKQIEAQKKKENNKQLMVQEQRGDYVKRDLEKNNKLSVKLYGPETENNHVRIRWKGTGLREVHIAGKVISGGCETNTMYSYVFTEWNNNSPDGIYRFSVIFHGYDHQCERYFLRIGIVNGEISVSAQDYADSACKQDKKYQKYKFCKTIGFIISIVAGCLWGEETLFILILHMWDFAQENRAFFIILSILLCCVTVITYIWAQRCLDRVNEIDEHYRQVFNEV